MLYYTLREPGMQPRLSAFVKRYGLYFQRVRDLESAEPYTIERWLLGSPIYIITNGDVQDRFHEWLAGST